MIRVMALEFKRNRLVKELNDRNLDVFNDIVKYIEVGLLNSLEREEIFQQVLDMILEAQSEGKFVSEVIGNDIKGFCDSIIQESIGNKNNFHICFDYIEGFFQLGIVCFFIFSIIQINSRGWDNFIKFKRYSTLYMVISIIVLAIVVPIDIIIKKKKIFQKNKKDYSYIFFLIFILIAEVLVNKLKPKFPKALITYTIPYNNIVFFIIIFTIAFGRDICYLTKSIYKKICENK